ncbi:hypothetical protein [Vibrio profundi]|uniref:hypothetical protein n=1 Tax=Vibrio profundi TaxID=1774960 RepID=UPI0037365DD5
MAAQKLTKGRLVQIVLMMVVLIAAFTWRTVIYEEGYSASCKLIDSCEIKIDSHNILLSKHKGGFLIETSESATFDISVENVSSVSSLNEKSWLVKTNEVDPVITVTDSQQQKPFTILVTIPGYKTD